jgi:hypothetical protein
MSEFQSIKHSQIDLNFPDLKLKRVEKLKQQQPEQRSNDTLQELSIISSVLAFTGQSMERPAVK